MKKIPIVLINGSLGSGKTTLVKRLLASGPFAGSLLIENEFASVNIDQQSIADDHGDEILEISGSCICCSTGEELESVIEEVVAKNWAKPVLLEATGMANSALLLRRLFLNANFTDHFTILCAVFLIDAAESAAGQLGKEELLEVKLSDVIVINKADLDTDNARDLAREVAKVNPAAVVITTSRAMVDARVISECASSAEMAFGSAFAEINDIDPGSATYAVVQINGPLDPARVRSALRPSSFGPRVTLRRAKGFFVDHDGNYWQVEATAKHIDLYQLKSAKASVLVAIGDGITKEAVRKVLA
jgi:G3E family GTPase